MKGKMSRLPFPSGRNRANEIGQLIHSDVCGQIQVASPGGSRYYVIFKDDYSEWNVINFIKHKSEVEEKFKNYTARLRVEKGKTYVNTLRTDQGGEYVGKNFSDWLDKEGIRHEMSAAYIPQQNGVSGRFFFKIYIQGISSRASVAQYKTNRVVAVQAYRKRTSD
jgi:hypothetical protein